jgi:hypothetical protein
MKIAGLVIGCVGMFCALPMLPLYMLPGLFIEFGILFILFGLGRG